MTEDNAAALLLGSGNEQTDRHILATLAHIRKHRPGWYVVAFVDDQIVTIAIKHGLVALQTQVTVDLYGSLRSRALLDQYVTNKLTEAMADTVVALGPGQLALHCHLTGQALPPGWLVGTVPDNTEKYTYPPDGEISIQAWPWHGGLALAGYDTVDRFLAVTDTTQAQILAQLQPRSW